MSPVPQTILQAQLIGAGLFHACAPLADATYAPPKLGWLTGEFDSWFRIALDRLGTAPFVAEAGDCDDFAMLYVALAKQAHRRMSDCAGKALPVGLLYYVSDTLGKHAVVVAITSDAGLVVIEPQMPGKLLNLTKTERASACLLVI